MLSRAHFPSAYKLLCLSGYFSRSDQDDRGKYVRRNFPLRPSFTPSNPPCKSQCSWQSAASFATERYAARKNSRKASRRVTNKRKDLAEVKLRRDFNADFGEKQIRQCRNIELSVPTYKFDKSLILTIISKRYEYTIHTYI